MLLDNFRMPYSFCYVSELLKKEDCYLWLCKKFKIK